MSSLVAKLVVEIIQSYTISSGMSTIYTLFSLDEDNHFIVPKQINVKLGDRVHLGCLLKSKLKWFHELTKFLPRNYPFAVDERFVSINSVQLKDSGNYFCYGEHPKSQLPIVSKSQLFVYGEM